MTTLVFQSFRRDAVPKRIHWCIQSVRGWCESNGFMYRFLGDELLDVVPDWVRSKCADSILPVTDLGRILWAKRFLDEGYGRVIWIDADVLVFAPHLFSIPSGADFFLCRETWVDLKKLDEQYGHRINNSISVYNSGSTFLRSYISLCFEIARTKDRIGSLDLGTMLFGGNSSEIDIPLLRNVGCFCGNTLLEIAKAAPGRWIDTYIQAHGAPIYAANLCNSFVAKGYPAFLFGYAVKSLLENRGGITDMLREARRGTLTSVDAPAG